MTTALLISLRETLEASLIVGIVLAFLQREGEPRAIRYAWLGAGLGIMVSIVVAYALNATAVVLSESQEELFEGILMLFAAGMLLWILVWLKRHGANVRGAIVAQVEDHLSEGAMAGIFLLCFIAVAREGVEMALFIQATIAATDTTHTALIGTITGVAVGIALTIGMLLGMRGLSLRLFFRLSNIILLSIGFGLAIRGIGELQEAHIITHLSSAVWDTSHWLSEESFVGHIARTLVGYESNPTSAQIIAGCIYLLSAFLLARLKRATSASSGM